MYKIWCHNNLGTIGKWGGIILLFGIIIVIFMFGRNFPLSAYVSDAVSTSSYSKPEFKLDLNPISNINDITLPVNDLINDALNGLRLNKDINFGTAVSPSPIKSPSKNIDFNQFFSSSKVSSDDITSFLKEATITGINLTLLIIDITMQVLKGLLSILK